MDDISEYLGVSRDSIYNWIERRAMPAHRVGRLWKFKKDAVDAWIRSGGADADSSTGGEERASADADAPGTKRTRSKPRGSSGE